MEKQYLVILGAVVTLIGTSFYIRDTLLDGKTKPNRVSWLFWAAAPLIAFAAEFSAGVGWGSVPIFMAGFTSLLIFTASFFNPKSYWKLERFDYGCGILSGVGLVLWLITKNPLMALVFALISDVLASVPTVVKSWKYPETESGILYWAALFNAGMAFFVVERFEFLTIAFPAYLVLLNVALVMGIYRRKT